MNNYIYTIFFLLISGSVSSQKYYDSNDLKYFIDFSNRNANLKFQDYKINGPIEDIISYYGNRYTIVRGDSIHWLLQQSEKRNKYLSYLILKGEYGEVQKLAKWEYSNKKLEVLASDRIYSGYFRDYFNFVDEDEYLKISSDRLIGGYLDDVNLLGDYKIKIFRDNGVNYFDLNIRGTLKLDQKGVIIETNLPTLTRFSGSYDSELNTNIEFIKKGIVAGRINFKERAIFSLNLDLEKKTGTLTSLEVEVNEDGVELNKRKTTTFIIED